jgi:hypothetical protein
MDWLLTFLLGCERNTLPKPIRLEGHDILRRFFERKNSRILEAPDVAFTIRIG